MSVIIFGNGPLPCEADYPVMAPGSRTWQILRTVAEGLTASAEPTKEIAVIGLDELPRSSGLPAEPISFVLSTTGVSANIPVTYYPLPYQQFVHLATGDSSVIALPPDIRSVVATGSVQPYSTGSQFAASRSLPVWVDVFGDPICETQSQLQLLPADQDAEAATKLVHVWKLFVDGLLNGDMFSALSARQRFALLGQLGCAGRLNQFTAQASMAHHIPYALFEEDMPVPDTSTAALPDDHFTVMWSGSFNTWMDVPVLTEGLANALRSNPQMRLLVVGGKIPGYNETSYAEFLEGIRAAGVEGAVTLLDWQPLSAMNHLYRRCQLGISIDRYTYEAELGSRTRLINFLAAGVPVVSTVVTELSQQLSRDNMLQPFELGNATSLTDALLKAAANSSPGSSNQGREYLLKNFNGHTWGKPLVDWIRNPSMASDKTADGAGTSTNALITHQKNLRASLGN